MNVLITGASGLVATQLTLWLLENTQHNLILLSRDSEKLASRNRDNRIICRTLEDVMADSDVKADVCVHTAFARSAQGKDLAESLHYTSKLLSWVKTINVRKFINISSQSVYGKINPPMWTENTVCAPDYMYAVAKFSAELIVKAYLQNTDIKWTNIRLSSVVENARFMRIFVQNAIDGIDINVSAPNQMVSFIDVRDVASGLGFLIESDKPLMPKYNLGSGKSYSIMDVANMVIKTGEYYGCNTTVNITGDNDKSKIGMDNALFCNEFNWYPQYSMMDSIKSLFEMLTNVNGGGYPQAFKIVYEL
jgi:nucleoside-diphosphate-sugar epimerase